MYKFSRCHAVIFHGFFIQFTVFSKNRPISEKIATPIFGKNHRFINEIGRLIIKIGRISVLQISTVPPLSPMRFGQFF
jgi:hypothetical protein